MLTVAPPLALRLPNHPFWYSSFSMISITFSWSSFVPTPVNSASSLALSITCILSTIRAGRLLTARPGSFWKKVFPSTVILFTASPFTLTEPSAPILKPGIFFRRSASMAFSTVRYALALNTTVSFFITTGLPAAVTLAASRNSRLCSICIRPRFFSLSNSDRLMSTSFLKCLYPTSSAFS